MRNIYLVGMSHKVADISVREKFYIDMDVKTRALQNSPFDELLILSTCNRTEAYVACDKSLEEDQLIGYVCSLVGQNVSQFAKYFYTKSGNLVAEHLMHVCAGLDSVAMGEDQILHQIGRAYETAHKLNATGNTLNKLFQGAIHTTKRIKTETNLSKLSCSIPFLAMKQVLKTFDDLENRSVYIVGLGEMGSLMLKYVQENTTKIFASSRTFSNAQKFEDVLTPVPFEDRYSVVGKSDVVVLCSACQEPIFTKIEFEKALEGSFKKARLVIDLGSPRNAESSVGEIFGVEYICVDQLQKMVDENRRQRMVEMEAAQNILQQGLEEFFSWCNLDDASKQINIYAEKLMEMAREESLNIAQSFESLSEGERDKLEMHFERFAKKIAHPFLYKVRGANEMDDIWVFLKCLDQVELGGLHRGGDLE